METSRPQQVLSTGATAKDVANKDAASTSTAKVSDLGALAKQVTKASPELRDAIRSAREATAEFVRWLEGDE